MTPYSQRDLKWANLKINNTTSLMKDYGCLITCLGMVADVSPDIVLSKTGFSGSQVSWEGLEKIGLELVEKTNTYDNTKVLKYIADYGQCIVRVDWDGSPKTDSDTHFVVYTGNKKLLDPWTGTERPTSTYPLVTGIRAVRKINMSTELDACMKDRQQFWDQRDDLLRVIGAPDVEGGKSMVAGYKSRITDLTNQLGTAQAEVKNREEQVGRLKEEAIVKEIEIQKLIQQVNQFAREKGELAIQAEQLKVQVDTLTQQLQEGSITLTWGDLFQLLLKQKITISRK